MAVTPSQYPLGLAACLTGDIDLNTDTIKCAIVGSGFAFNAAHQFWSDVSAQEVTGTGYTAGGATVTGLAVTVSGDIITIDCDDVTWTASTITGRGVVFYKATGTAGTSRLIAAQLGSTDTISSAGTWTFSPAGTGIATIDANA